MTDHDLGDEHVSRRIRKPYDGLWPKAYELKQARRRAGVCINGGPKSKVEHGPVISGSKCARCHEAHRKSA